MGFEKPRSDLYPSRAKISSLPVRLPRRCSCGICETVFDVNNLKNTTPYVDPIRIFFKGLPIWRLIGLLMPVPKRSLPFSTMPIAFKPKKVKPKGTVHELKLVNMVNRHGLDTLQTEEVKTPKNGQQSTSSPNHRNPSSSPVKHQKLDNFNIDPISFNLDDPDIPKKRQTLVSLF